MKRLLIVTALLLSASAAFARGNPPAQIVDTTEITATRHIHIHRKFGTTAYVTPIAYDYGSNIIATAAHYMGSRNPTGKPGAWCAHFVNFILQKTGFRPVNSGMAIAMRRVGPPTYPHPGAVAYNYRHTGFVASVHGNRIVLLSGNSHHGHVSMTTYNVASYRYAEPVH